MKTDQKILRFLEKHGETTINSLAEKLKFSRQFIHKVINLLIEKKIVTKLGTAPHVYYKLNETTIERKTTEVVTPSIEVFLNQHFLTVDATGNLLHGFAAMQYWAKQQGLNTLKTSEEFVATRKKYLTYFGENDLIDGIPKLRNTKGIAEIGVDELFYIDFYAIERFGKTKLGTLMHYAKQGQNKKLMKLIVELVKNKIHYYLSTHSIEAILYVPPTIKRKLQIMDYMQQHLEINLPIIEIKKISNEIIIPQKALSKLHERIANAKHTFIVPKQKKYKTVLIIDDAIGSGATINEIALKIKHQKIATHIIGLAITGSFKGFDVISEL